MALDVALNDLATAVQAAVAKLTSDKTLATQLTAEQAAHAVDKAALDAANAAVAAAEAQINTLKDQLTAATAG